MAAGRSQAPSLWTSNVCYRFGSKSSAVLCSLFHTPLFQVSRNRHWYPTLLLASFVLLLSHSISAEVRPRNNANVQGSVPGGSVLYPGDGEWPSPNENYVMKLREDGTLGIEMMKWGNVTVWTAQLSGRNLKGAKAIFQVSGSLELYASDNRLLWSTGTDGNRSSAVMEDGGNFRIQADQKYLWESFKNLTDTMVQGMVVNDQYELRNGTRYLGFLEEGNLALFKVGVRTPLYDNRMVYWSTNINATPTEFRLDLNSEYGLAVLDPTSNGQLWSTKDQIVLPDAASEKSQQPPRYYASLDRTGNLKLWRWVGADSVGSWQVVWRALSNLCDAAPCGEYEVCKSNSSMGDSYVCDCLDGFVNDEYYGCRPPITPQCSQKADQFREVMNVGFIGYDINSTSVTDFMACKSLCMQVCDCMGFTYNESTRYCGLKSKIESGIHAQGSKTYVRVGRRDGRLDKMIFIVSGVVPVGTIVVFAIAVLCWWRVRKALRARHRNRELAPYGNDTEKGNLESSVDEERVEERATVITALGGPRAFSYRQLDAATTGFNTVLGKGGFSIVYRGVLPEGTIVAVKVLTGHAQRAESEFLSEVAAIGRLQHSNIVALLGFCSEGSHRMLVYEFMANGDLHNKLFGPKRPGAQTSTTFTAPVGQNFNHQALAGGARVTAVDANGSHQTERTVPAQAMNPPNASPCDQSVDMSWVLDWKSRNEIALGVARGISYLHGESRKRIIHCDIKPKNILLDDRMVPHVADFGLARSTGQDESRVYTDHVRGTIHYLSPEYALHGILTDKSDVYSFGIMLLEMLSGRRNLEVIHPPEEPDADIDDQQPTIIHLPSMASSYWEEMRPSEFADHRLGGNFVKEEFERMMQIGLQCSHIDPALRPTMASVVQMLMGLIPVPSVNRAEYVAAAASYLQNPWPQNLKRTSDPGTTKRPRHGKSSGSAKHDRASTGSSRVERSSCSARTDTSSSGSGGTPELSPSLLQPR
ncbi:hypothetical protein CBR_g40888 [Chara braunii]|uniref:non-specific serine/threonine protein kinase n=1 Tax=Chara braunii TaxID=69332 RepID=A0A388K2B3_CHABU|nr:hypothetical protein CBR_g40888 [Chara braunii]|eukprot:GBG64188.1 hypothetical protein CBR_g40888 [Chara braunii]